MASAEPRIAILGMHLESNAFAPATSGDDFRACCHLLGERITAEAARPAPAMPAEIPGFIAEMDRAGAWQPVPVLLTAAEPGGPVEHGFLRQTCASIRSMLAGRLPVDAVYISSHGAMVSTGMSDPDGALYRMVRELVGDATPVVATVDLHANISEQMVASTDAIISYRTNPHVDQAERAAEAARLLVRMLDGARLVAAFQRLPIVAPTVTLLTARGPYADLIAAGQAACGEGLDLVSVVGGFAFSDTPHNGLAILAYGAGDRPARAAAALAAQAWTDRERFQARLTPIAEAIAAASRAGQSAAPAALCLADVADNPGGGGRGNTTEILQALIAAPARSVLFGMFVDAALARDCHAAGVGAAIEARFNAAVPEDESTRRFTARAEILGLSGGEVVGRRGIYRGRSIDLGPSAALRIGEITLVVISRRVQCADPAFLESLGLDIAGFRTVVVKSRGHFRAGFDEFIDDSRIIEVDAGGLTSPVLSRFAFANLPRPVYPLDPQTTWEPSGEREILRPAWR